MDSTSSLSNETNTKKRKSMENEFHCEICKVTCNSEETMDSHLSGMKHKVKEVQNAMIQKDSDGKEYKVVDADDNNDEMKGLWCKICNVKCSGKATMLSHLNGRKHKAKKMRTAACDEELKVKVSNEGGEGDLQKKRVDFNVEKKDKECSTETSTVGKITDGSWCLVCKAKFRDQTTLIMHLNGNYHKSEEEKLRWKKKTEMDEGDAKED